MTKIMIVILVISVVLIMMGGMSILKGSYYWHVRYFSMQLGYLEAQKAFFDYNYGGFWHYVAYRQKIGESYHPSGKNAKSIPVLLYHGVIDDPNWKPDGVNIRLSDFQNQMFALKIAGYQTISIDDYSAFLKGEKELPEKSFLLTFDDGRRDSYYRADPVLRTVGYKAAMFIITSRTLGAGNEKNTFHLSELETEKMVESGRWEIESHGKDDHDLETIDSNGSRGHFLSDKLWLADESRLETDKEYEARIKKDLEESKLDIEKNLGIPVKAFAYPFGDYGQGSNNFQGSREMLASATDSTYPLAFYQSGSGEFPTNYAQNGSSLSRRISVDSEIGARELVSMLNNIEDKSVPYSDDFKKNNGWMEGWGSINAKNGALVISSDKTDDSSLTFLGGSYLWNNYYAHVTAEVLDGNAFTLGGRFKDENNYVSCNYYDSRVTMLQTVAGRELPELEALVLTNIGNGKSSEVGISVNGSKASCFWDGKPIISGSISPGLKFGGISFKIWDTSSKGSKLILRSLKVDNPL